MPIELRWDNDHHTILYLRASDDWTWQEWYALDEQRRAMLDAVDHPVDLITDITDLKIPSDVFSQFGRLREGSGYSHPRIRRVVMIGIGRLMRNLLNGFFQLYGTNNNQYFMVKSLEEAYDLLQANPPSETQDRSSDGW